MSSSRLVCVFSAGERSEEVRVHVISSGGREDTVTVTLKEAAQRRDRLQLVCQVTGAAPPADVYWTVPGLGSGHELHKGASVNTVLAGIIH